MLLIRNILMVNCTRTCHILFFFRKQSHISRLKILFYRAANEYFFIQMVKRVFEDSGNTFRTTVRAIKLLSQLFRDYQVFIFQKNRWLALSLKTVTNEFT